jgi:hypothetical protein
MNLQDIRNLINEVQLELTHDGDYSAEQMESEINKLVNENVDPIQAQSIVLNNFYNESLARVLYRVLN